jgi:hypothetical protein
MHKNTYIFKLLINVIAARIETLVSGNEFLYACAKKNLPAVNTAAFSPSINFSLLLKRCDPTPFFL